jgi:hyperosmotically inducible protein
MESKNITTLSTSKVISPGSTCLKYITLALTVWGFTSCSQLSKDKEIKADIATKTKTDLNFAGVNYTVEKGMVTLTGKCPSEKSKAEAEQTIKGINIIKGINNQVMIAPVTITADLPLKQAVDSILKTYPTVQADVAQNIVTLTGKAKQQDASQLLPAVNSLHPAKVNNQLIME